MTHSQKKYFKYSSESEKVENKISKILVKTKAPEKEKAKVLNLEGLLLN